MNVSVRADELIEGFSSPTIYYQANLKFEEKNLFENYLPSFSGHQKSHYLHSPNLYLAHIRDWDAITISFKIIWSIFNGSKTIGRNYISSDRTSLNGYLVVNVRHADNEFYKLSQIIL